ncbi:MAG: hypothetical protein JNK02_12800 [Planctomycetes bacterium]|nr:hypothetical protein [Planctomycetota bacterium]
MRAVNVLLAVLVSLAIAALVAEGGLRLLGLGPQPTLHRFDPDTGWSKKPDATIRRATSEFDVTITTNALGLRDDPLSGPTKPSGTRRVLALGDSFVLGYTVDREDLFVDLLERRWRAEGRPIDVLNAGTEGWSTDQEAVWLDVHGRAFQPDVVLLFPYENDLYWNGELAYLRFPKPRFSVTGPREPVVLVDPGATGWFQRTAIGRFVAGFGGERRTWTPPGSERRLEPEHAAYWREAPAFMAEALRRTRSALASIQRTCDAIGAELVVVPIPGKASIDPGARAALESQILGQGVVAGLRRKLLGGTDPRSIPSLAPETAWTPDQPVETFLALAGELNLRTLDVREAFRARAARGESLYFVRDWHLDANGNRALAEELHRSLDGLPFFGGELAARGTGKFEPARPKQAPVRWPWWYAGLVLVLGTVYARTYKDVAPWQAYAITAGMLGLVFAIAVGGARLIGRLDPALGRAVLVVFVLLVLSFVVVKLGRRLGTIAELLVAFTRRGHWYLMPLVVILLTIGSLLVVAASSPLVAPFIYTLF